METSFWLNPSILSYNNQDRIIIQKIAAVNWNNFRKVTDIGVVDFVS